MALNRLAGLLNKPLALAPQSRSALVQHLLQQSGSPQGIVSPAGTANKALQGLLLRRANIAEKKDLEQAKESLSRALGLPQPTNIVLDDVMGGPSETRTIQPAMNQEQKQLAALLGGLPPQGIQAAQLAMLQRAISPEGAEPYTLGPGQTRYGANNQVLASVPAKPEGAESLPNLVNEVSDDLYRESQEFGVQLSSMGRIRQSVADPSPAGDLSLIYSYMKMLDPNSSVRESEYATAENARGIPATVRNIWNRVQNGLRLEIDQREDFVNRAERLFAQSRADQGRRNERFLSRATSLGIPKEMFAPLLLPLDPSQVGNNSQSAPVSPPPTRVSPPVGPPILEVP